MNPLKNQWKNVPQKQALRQVKDLVAIKNFITQPCRVLVHKKSLHTTHEKTYNVKKL